MGRYPRAVCHSGNFQVSLYVCHSPAVLNCRHSYLHDGRTCTCWGGRKRAGTWRRLPCHLSAGRFFLCAFLQDTGKNEWACEQREVTFRAPPSKYRKSGPVKSDFPKKFPRPITSPIASGNPGMSRVLNHSKGPEIPVSDNRVTLSL